MIKNFFFRPNVKFCGSTSFPWLVIFFGALLWGYMIHKHTERWMWQGSASVVSWNWHGQTDSAYKEFHQVHRTGNRRRNVSTVKHNTQLEAFWLPAEFVCLSQTFPPPKKMSIKISPARKRNFGDFQWAQLDLVGLVSANHVFIRWVAEKWCLAVLRDPAVCWSVRVVRSVASEVAAPVCLNFCVFNSMTFKNVTMC